MYKLLRTTFITDKMDIQRNNIKPGNFKLTPSITRKTGKIKENVYFTALSLRIKSTDTNPFPVDINVDFRGVFEFKDIDNEENISEFLKIEAVRIMFPYLRSITSNLSTAAMMPPILLPIVDTAKIFKNRSDSVLIN
jgi:preprotein translocase subunit SecB